MHAEQGSKLSERSEFLDPPQATAEARVAEGQVEGGLSFASFSLAAKENEVVWDQLFGSAFDSDPAQRTGLSSIK